MEEQTQEPNLPPSEPQQNPTVSTPQTSPVSATPPQPQVKKSRKKLIIIVLVAVIVVVGVALAAYFIHKHDTKKLAVQQTKTTSSVTQKQQTTPVATASWSIVNTPNEGSAPNNELNGLSCLTSSNCIAVGDYNLDNSTGSKTLVEQWNGSSWSITNSPNISGNSGDQLNSVYCTSSSNCWAVGGGEGYGTPAVIEQWNGSSWSLETSGVASVGKFLGITCTSSSNCWAVGDANQSGSSLASLVEHWNGSQWSTVSTPKSNQANLEAVTCVTSSDCWTVGDINNGNGSNSLIEQWNGSTWSAVTTQDPNGYENAFSGVECTSSSSCMAVGLSNSTTATNYIVTAWNGSSWRDTTYPNPSGISSVGPQTITCVNDTNCWIVGVQSATQSAAPTLIALNWNGSSWNNSTSLTTPPAPAAGSQSGPAPPALSTISCTKANYCMTVGSYTNKSNSNQETLSRTLFFSVIL